jgi:hypothetical protein
MILSLSICVELLWKTLFGFEDALALIIPSKPTIDFMPTSRSHNENIISSSSHAKPYSYIGRVEFVTSYKLAVWPVQCAVPFLARRAPSRVYHAIPNPKQKPLTNNTTQPLQQQCRQYHCTSAAPRRPLLPQIRSLRSSTRPQASPSSKSKAQSTSRRLHPRRPRRTSASSSSRTTTRCCTVPTIQSG